MKLEFYDYATAPGRAETHSDPNDPRVGPLVIKLFNQYVPTQMEAPLPGTLKATVKRARASYLVFQALTNAYSLSQLIQGQQLKTTLGFSGNF